MRKLKFLQYEQRLISFEYWPRSVSQTKEKMAKAGFYYYNLSDCVRCFYCGCRLRNWEPFDDPWEQHALWFPECVFVLVSKGQNFINRVHSQIKKYAYSPGNFAILSGGYNEGLTTPPPTIPPSPSKRQLLKKLKILYICSICTIGFRNRTLMPCRHTLCANCVTRVDGKCPYCRNVIDDIIESIYG